MTASVSSLKTLCDFLVLSSSIFFLGPLHAAETINISSDLPLGLAYDQTYIWVSDPRQRTLLMVDPESKKTLAQKKLKIEGIRGIAFHDNHLFGVYKKAIYKINPINGNVVERRSTAVLADPVNIAYEKRNNIFYIFNRSDQRWYLYSWERSRFSGSIPIPRALKNRKMRGAVFYRDHLWVASDKQTVIKLNPKNAEILVSLPTREEVYSVTFAQGKLFAGAENKLRHIPYVETETYIATGETFFQVEGKLKWTLPWDKETLKKERTIQMSVRLLRTGGHQRILRAKATERRLTRKEFGERELLLDNAFLRSHDFTHLKISLRSYDTRFFLSPEKISEYYRTTDLPKETLRYLSLNKLEKKVSPMAEFSLNRWNQLSEEGHPWQMCAFVSSIKMPLPDKLYFFRKLGIPARGVALLHARNQKITRALEIYIKPVGWFPLTEKYSASDPKTFPIDAESVELWIIDSVQIRPEKSSRYVMDPLPDIFHWENGQIREESP